MTHVSAWRCDRNGCDEVLVSDRCADIENQPRESGWSYVQIDVFNDDGTSSDGIGWLCVRCTGWLQGEVDL